jgi:hypothetical protein
MEFVKSQGREIQRGAWWAQVETGSRESMFLFLSYLKTYNNLGEEENQVIPIQ